jgi:hypothetical protein
LGIFERFYLIGIKILFLIRLKLVGGSKIVRENCEKFIDKNEKLPDDLMQCRVTIVLKFFTS